jgi:hypothetical protein
MLVSRIDTLLRDIETQRQVIDKNLSRPSRWRGQLRRELCGRTAPAERALVAASFDQFIRPPFIGMPVGVPFLLAMHDAAVGGCDFRVTGARVRVGTNYSPLCPPPSVEVPELVAQALERATDGMEHPVLASARLHLELLLIHPFSDGNGRTARLISSFLLVRSGYRSTLLTAVEQHFSENPPAYTKAFIDLGNGGGTDHWSWLVTALEAMAAHSRLAFLYCTGEWSPGKNEAKTRRDLEAQLARITEEEHAESLRPAGAPIFDVWTDES